MGRASGRLQWAAAASTATRRAGVSERVPVRFQSAQDALRFLGPASGALLSELGRHHPYTGRHSLRVANLVQACCKSMRIPAPETAKFVKAALLHDVGKIDVPVRILDDPGRPGPEDWKTLQAHSDAGHRRVAALAGNGEIARIVRGVHEKMDGSGYPDGLAGERIPLGSRIIAVCDAYEAMTSDERSYKPAFSAALTEMKLTDMAGEQFDEEAVNTLFEALAEADTHGDLARLLLRSGDPADRALAAG